MTSMQADGTTLPSQTAEAPLSTSSDPNSKLGIQLPKVLLDLQLERKKRAWVSWVDTEYVKARNARQPFERQWHINLAFTSGRQYVSPVNVPGAGFRLVAPKAPPWRVRMVINKIRTAVRTEASKLTSSRPLPVVIPATTEDEDYAAARVAEKILRSEFATHQFDATTRSWAWWGVVTGNSFLKSYYDPSKADDFMQKPPTINPLTGQVNVEPAVGKICTERVNPFHIYIPDLLEEDIENQPFVIHVMTRTPQWIRNNFGFNATPDSRATNTIMESAILSPGVTNDAFDSVLVKEVWIKPNSHPDFPKGGLITICADRVVQYRDSWPLPFSEYPFYKYNGIPTGGFYCDSVVNDLIPIQKEYNRTKSQMIEIKNTMGKPKLLYPRGAINPRQISSEPGQGIPYTPGYDKPTVLPPAEVPATMGMELDRLSSDFDDISGQHEITRGNTPSQVTSGTAISFLQEQDDSKLAYQVASIENSMSKLGTHYLKYASHYWTEERLVRVVGRDNEFEAFHWKGSDLRGNTDVRVQSGSALPFSKAARQALITELMQNGFLDPQTGMEMMELGGLDKILEDFLVDKRAAQRENLKMAEADPAKIASLVNPPVDPMSGQPVMGEDGVTLLDPMTGEPWQPQPPLPVNSWDNHQAHIMFHNRFRKTQQFELLDDAVKQMFELHVQAHQMALSMPQMGAAGVVNNAELAQAPANEEPPVGQGGEAQSSQETSDSGVPEQPPA